MSDDTSLRVTDTSKILTAEELDILKTIALYYSTGRIVGVVLISIGAFAVTVIKLWEFAATKLGAS